MKAIFSSLKKKMTSLSKDSLYFSEDYRHRIKSRENRTWRNIYNLKFVFPVSIDYLEDLSNGGSDYHNYGLYYLTGVGKSLCEFNGDMRFPYINHNKGYNLITLFSKEDLDVCIMYRLTSKLFSYNQVSYGMTIFFSNSKDYTFNKNSLSLFHKSSVFDIVSRVHDNTKKHNYTQYHSYLYRMIDLVLFNINKNIFDTKEWDNIIMKNIIVDVSLSGVYVKYLSLLGLHNQLRFILTGIIHYEPDVIYYVDEHQYIKQLFFCIDVQYNQIKVRVYDYYESRNREMYNDMYYVLLDNTYDTNTDVKELFSRLMKQYDNKYVIFST